MKKKEDSVKETSRRVLLIQCHPESSYDIASYLQEHGILYDTVSSIADAKTWLHDHESLTILLAFSFYQSPEWQELLIPAKELSSYSIIGIVDEFSFEYATSFYQQSGIDCIQVPDDIALLAPLLRGRNASPVSMKRNYTLTVGRLALERMPFYPASLLFKEKVIDDRVRFQLNLAFQEALMNSLEHGNLGLVSAWKEEINHEGLDTFTRLREERVDDERYKNSVITVNTSFNGHTVDIKIIDSGQGFSIGSMETVPGSQIPVSCFGRGCSIILNTMDDMQYSMGGRCIQMKKILRA